jgi:hypothetical protein
MTLQQAGFVQNSIILGLLVWYGIWQKYIKDDLFKSKDAAIAALKDQTEALKAAIQTKEAQISALQADTAPIIAAKYNTLKNYVIEVTAESQQQSQQIKQTSKELADMRYELDNERRTSDVQRKLRNEITIASGLLGEVKGIAFALKLISSQVSDSFSSMNAPPSDVDTVIEALANLSNTIEHAIEQLDTERENKRLETQRLLDNINSQMESSGLS